MGNFKSFVIIYFFILLPVFANAQVRCESILLSSAEQIINESKKEVVAYVSNQLDDHKVDKVITEFLNLYSSIIGNDVNQVMSENQFSKLYSGLKSIADRYHIKIENKKDLVGVFPEGLRKIKISGFSGTTSTPNESASFLKRHELAHLFHVLALRVVLIENSVELSELSAESLDQYIEVIEGGRNYLEFEKIVTDISGALHSVNKAASLNTRYSQKLNVLMNGLRLALKSGKVKFPNGWSLVELYANFISKAPILLGKSIWQLGTRMSLMVFIEFYYLDDNFRNFLWSSLSR